MKILLTTLHAKYVHASLALPYLSAFCGAQSGVCPVIREFTVNEPQERVLRAIVAEEAEVVAFSCYIWNVAATLRLAADLKLVRPRTVVILGGPEVSYGASELLAGNPAVDAIVRGDGEATFGELVRLLAEEAGNALPDERLEEVAGLVFRSGDEIVTTGDRGPLADLDVVPSPFAAGLVDLGKPLVYYESSRGCPFACAFCMSSLERGVRSFSPERIRADLTLLMEREVATIKLVDRTFNFDPDRADAIWEFILRHNRASRFHFEIAADLLTDANIRLLGRVPAGLFRFEIGVQSTLADTLERVGRSSNLERLFANVRRLREETGITLHLDLVAGLPHEDLAGFQGSLQRLLDLRPHHIQVEPLKVLKGSPMRRIARESRYAYSSAPPYTVLRTPWLSFEEIGRLTTCARLLDLYYNSGTFAVTLQAIAAAMPLAAFFSAFAPFWDEGTQLPHLSPGTLFQRLWQFSLESWPELLPTLRDTLRFDFCLNSPQAGALPEFLRAGEPAGAREPGRPPLPELARRLAIPAGSRVRTCTATFLRDYSRTPWEAGPVTLTFVHVTTPGKGESVTVLRD